MKKNAHETRSKSEKLLQLYSLWQETRREELQQKCLQLLNDITNCNPSFRLRNEFQRAF